MMERLVRPALEAAVVVARAGEAAEPPVRAPAAIRKVLRFARLNNGALAAIRRTVERDDEFRVRVAENVDPEAVGRASWLWLARPDQWRKEFDALATVVAEADDEAATSRDTARLRRDLDAAHQKIGLAEDARRRAEQKEAEAKDALAAERAARRAADERLVSTQTEHSRLSDERAAAVRSLKEAEAAHEVTRSDRRLLRSEVRRLEAAVERLEHRSPSEDLPAAPSSATLPTGSQAGAPTVDLDRVAAAVKEAAAAATSLGAALDRAAGGLGRAGGAGPPTEPSPGSRPEPGARRNRSARPRRRPSALPRAIFEETSEAADHLIRLPGAVLLVDGYNVSMAAWPEQTIEDQRARLVTALDELHARTGVDPLVVFDGVLAGGPPPGSARRAVRVRFTDEGVEADDVVLALVEDCPSERPVVVASSDQRVRDGARKRGANVVTSRQLLAVLRR